MLAIIADMFVIDFQNATNQQLQQQCSDKLAQRLEPWEHKVWSFLDLWLNPAINHITVYSSGSTGKPRPYQHSKQVLIASAQATCRFLGIQHGQNALLALPADKIGGMMMVVRSWLYKMPLFCIAPTINPIKELPSGVHFHLAAFTPMQVAPVVNSYELFKELEAIDIVILGGSEVPRGITQWLKGLTNRLYATFGMTETVSHIALKKLNAPEADEHFRLVPGVEIATDERGCLQITAPALQLNQLQTNDVVVITGPAQFDWLGRFDNVINTGGLKVYPETLEQEWKEVMMVPFFIAGIPDPVSGQKVVLVIERDSITEKEVEATRQYFKNMAQNTRPRQLLLVPRFLRTETGKIKRAESLHRVETRIDL